MPSDQHHKQNPPTRFAWIATILTPTLIIASQFLPRGGNLNLRITGVFLLLLSPVFIFPPFLLMRKYGGTKDDHSYLQTQKIVDRGVFAITRHPQYFGYMLLAAGFALLSQHWAAILLMLLAVTSFYLQAVMEEGYLLSQLGDSYAEYKLRVPRFNIILGLIRLFKTPKQDIT